MKVPPMSMLRACVFSPKPFDRSHQGRRAGGPSPHVSWGISGPLSFAPQRLNEESCGVNVAKLPHFRIRCNGILASCGQIGIPSGN